MNLFKEAGTPVRKPFTVLARYLSARDDRAFILWLTGVALLLRLWGINQDLWLDEIATLVGNMRLSPLETAATFNSANQHLLNSVTGSISIRIFGESTWAVRLPALLFGVATIPVFFMLARAVTNRAEAIFATLFLTISYHHVWFSQNARGYSAMIFFTVLSTLLLVRWLENRNTRERKNLWWFSLCGALGMMSLLNYAFVLMGQFLMALVTVGASQNHSRIPILLVSGALIVVLTLLGYAAALPAMVEYFSGGGEQMGWKNPVEFALVFARGLTGALPATAMLALSAAGIVAAAGWLSYLKRQRMIALMLVLPPLFNIIALAILDFGAYPRSFLYIMPFGILVLIRGAFVLSAWTGRLFRFAGSTGYVLPVLLLLVSALMLPHNYRYPKQNYTGALAYTRAQAAPGDVIVAVGYLASGYRKYYAPDLDFPESASALDDLRGQGHRVWVLYSFTRDMRRHFPDIQDYIEKEFQMQRVFPGTLGDGTVYLTASPPTG
jgi:4-amino-4-deoxy-L-arabinose transferase-like glycosyltransferase